MHLATRNEQKDPSPTILELVLRLHGDFRRSLEPVRATPLQAGVLLYLRRHAESRLVEVATALRVQPPTMGEVVQDLVRKRWVTKRRSLEDRRAVRLQLTPRGKSIAQTIQHQVHHIVATLTEHDGRMVDALLPKEDLNNK